jgi:hypothetical protein
MPYVSAGTISLTTDAVAGIGENTHVSCRADGEWLGAAASEAFFRS